MSILSIGELLDLGNSASTAGLVPYSALEYNASGDISGISGSAIAGGVDTTIVSSIASSYVESGVSSKVDQSAFDECCSAMSAVVSAKLDASASGQFAPSGDYVFNSSYSSFTGDVTNNISSISSIVSGITGDWSSKADTSALDDKMDKSASSQFAPSGDYAYNSALSSYVNYSAISGENGKVTSINGSGISAQAVPTLPLYVASPLTAGIDEMSSQVTIGLPGVVVQIVSSEAEATGTNIVYVVTGSN